MGPFIVEVIFFGLVLTPMMSFSFGNNPSHNQLRFATEYLLYGLLPTFQLIQIWLIGKSGRTVGYTQKLEPLSLFIIILFSILFVIAGSMGVYLDSRSYWQVSAFSDYDVFVAAHQKSTFKVLQVIIFCLLIVFHIMAAREFFKYTKAGKNIRGLGYFAAFA